MLGMCFIMVVYDYFLRHNIFPCMDLHVLPKFLDTKKFYLNTRIPKWVKALLKY